MSLALEIDTTELDKLVKGLGKVGSELVSGDIQDVMYDHLQEIKEHLIENPPVGIPSDIDWERCIDIDVQGTKGMISIDTRLGVDEEEIDKSPEQEKKNIAWFLEYGKIGSEPKPFLRPIVEENQSLLENRIGNVVIKSLENNLEGIRAEYYLEKGKGNIKTSNSIKGQLGGLTSSLNKIRAQYGEVL